MADQVVKSRCKSHSYNRFHLASVHQQTMSKSEDICNLAYISLHAPRRFRKNWQQAYNMWLQKLQRDHAHEVGEAEKVAAREHKEPAGLCGSTCVIHHTPKHLIPWI